MFFPTVVVGLSCCVLEVVVRGYTLQVPNVLVGFSVGLLVLVFCPFFLYVSALLAFLAVFREKTSRLRTAGHRRMRRHCIGVWSTWDRFFPHSGQCRLFQLLFLISLQSAVSPTVFLVAETQGMWKLFGTIDDRVVQRTSRRTR